MKPLGMKSYGSIPHLPGSKTGLNDYKIHQGQANIATVKCRPNDVVYVTEKLDGSCCAVAKINGNITALSRSGYKASESPYTHISDMFKSWVRDNERRFDLLLKEGERAVGEWMAQAHSIRYELFHEPFVVFDLMTGHKRLGHHDFIKRTSQVDLNTPNIVHIGGACEITRAMSLANPSRHGALEAPEGVVYRVENAGEVDFLCKYVRHDFVPGALMPSYKNGYTTTWNRNFTEWIA
jgi:hypothetical protein